MVQNSGELELDAILQVLANFPEGASYNDIAGSFPTISKRTLQRWLRKLKERGQIATEGKTKGTVYRLIDSDSHSRPSKGASLSVSKKAAELQERVTQSLKLRTQAFYQRELIDSYEPNSTFYLSRSVRDKLWGLGSTNGNSYPSGTYAKKIFHRLLIDLSWNSSRLEGNTYSLLETERLIDSGIVASGKSTMESQMILNHKAAIEFLIELGAELEINSFVVRNIHALLADNLLPDLSCGAVRTIPVGIQESVYHPLNIPQLVEEIFRQILEKASKIQDPFEQAFFLLVQLPYLQPFEDVNKRTSRLAANIPLFKNNLVPLSFVDVPSKLYIDALLGVYEFNEWVLLEELFIWAYERSCFLYTSARSNIGEPDKFRLQNREIIIHTVGEIVRSKLDKVAAIALIRKSSEVFKKEDESSRFIEIVERELQSLHEGNIARYRIRPSEFSAWTKIWK